MTSEELAAYRQTADHIEKRIADLGGGEMLVQPEAFSICINAIRKLLAAVEEQQKEIAFLHNVIADLQADASPDSQHKATLRFISNAVLKQLRDLRAEKLKEGHPVASLYFLARDYHNAASETKAMWDQQQEQLQSLGSVQACNHMIDWLLALVGLKASERFE